MLNMTVGLSPSIHAGDALGIWMRRGRLSMNSHQDQTLGPRTSSEPEGTVGPRCCQQESITGLRLDQTRLHRRFLICVDVMRGGRERRYEMSCERRYDNVFYKGAAGVKVNGVESEVNFPLKLIEVVI